MQDNPKGSGAKPAPAKPKTIARPAGTKPGAKTHTPAAKLNGWQRFIKGVAAIPKRVQRSVMNTIAELKKVTWPTKDALISYSLVVVVFMVVLAIIVGVLDLGASQLVRLIIRV
jgi:preprotein translocase subunit SecE